MQTPNVSRTSLITVRRSLFTLLTLLLLAALAPQAEAGASQMKITFGGYTNRSEVLTNFPVLVVFSNNVGGSSSFTYADFATTNGYDLRFATNSTDTTNSLNYEIESWNTNGASYVWVQVPTIPTNGSGAIWANWGNTSASNQLPCTTNGATWTNGYAGVWHLKEASGTPYDSSTNLASAIVVGAGVTQNATGKIGVGCSFNATSGSGITNSASRLPSGTAARTMTTWFKLAATGQNNREFGGWGDNTAATKRFAWWLTTSALGLENQGTAHQFSWTQDTGWHLVTATYAAGGNLGSCKLYMDGASKTITVNGGTAAINTTTKEFKMGGIPTASSSEPNCSLDEFRISSVERSSNWVWAEYLNMASNTVFNNYGAMVAGLSITVGATSNRFDNTYVNATSTWSYTISGSGLTNNLTVSVPSPSVFTISSNDVDYGSEVILTTNELGAVPLTNIWVRFIPTSDVAYSEFITNASAGAETKLVQVTGLGLAANTPTLTVTPFSLAFGNVITNKTSANQMFTVTGANLTNHVTVTAPPECFWLSTNGTDFSQSPVTLTTNASGGLDITNIYVRFTPTGEQAYDGSITNSSTGASDQTVAVSGTGVVQGISVSAGSLNFGNVIKDTTSNLTYTVSGSNLEADVTLTVPGGTGFTIKTNGGAAFGTSVTLTVPNQTQPAGGTLSEQTIVVQFAPTAVQAYGPTDITAASTGAADKTTTLNGTGIEPTLYISGGTLDFGSVVTGKFSWIPTSYTVSGSNLSANVTVSAPAGFQVSTSSGSGFGSSLTLTQSGGTLASTTVYGRFIPTLVQSYAGASITNSSTGAADALQGVTGTGVDYGSKISTGGDSIYVRTVSGVDYYVHVFTNTGVFTPKVSLNVEYLVIGGGGGGGHGNPPGGGGGAGGFVTGTVTIASSASITVGPGGTGAVGNAYGQQGSNSILAVNGGSTITAYGGGYGGGGGDINGAAGGCGGGGSTAGTGGTGSQGKNGGAGHATSKISGGGGGAGQAGAVGAGVGGKGGDGTNSTITGSDVWYCGGGAGNTYQIGGANVAGGAGGGGSSLNNARGVDATYYGSGGGGGGQYDTGGKGFRGIVIVRYALPPASGTVFLFR